MAMMQRLVVKLCRTIPLCCLPHFSMDGGGGEPLARLRGSQVVYEIEEAETKIGRKESCDIVRAEPRLCDPLPTVMDGGRTPRNSRLFVPAMAVWARGRRC